MQRENRANDRLPRGQAGLQKSKTKSLPPRTTPYACFPPRTCNNPFVRGIYIKKAGASATAAIESEIEEYAIPEGTVAAKIEVEKTGEGEFRVRVAEGASDTTHRVTLKPADYQRLTEGKVEPAQLVRRSFEFLLENEAKESILARFDLSVISRYFPQFEHEIKRRLGG